ncbi:MAG TPA: mechanosensitive ion channel [Syntrophales bacterium]|nr:mechanosensitive ion channel [Syntrophales bacterium]
MKKILMLLLFVGVVLFGSAWADDVVTITSNDIQLNEPGFTDFVKQKYPFLVDKLYNLAKETDLLHLNVDFNNFDEFWNSVTKYYVLEDDLSKNIPEYESEAQQVRRKIFEEGDLKSPTAITLILDYKFLRKNIDYAKMSLDSLTRDFNMLFIVLRNKPITADVQEVTDLRTYAAAMVNNISALKAEKITIKDFNKTSKSLFQSVAKVENAENLHRQFLAASAELTGKGQFLAKIKGGFGGIGNLVKKIYTFELYIVENKKVTLGGMLGLLIVIAVIIAAYLLAQKRLYQRLSREKGTWHAFNMLSKYVLILAIALITLFGLGLDLGKVTLLVSAVSVGIGFGLQKIFSNLVSGIILLFDKSIKLGDTLQVGELYGTVTSMNARFVSVQSRDGREHLIPNESLIVNNVVNLTYSAPRFRLGIPVGVSYKSDVMLAMRLMEKAAEGISRVLPNPEPNTCLIGFGESSVDLELRVWISDPDQGLINVKSDILVAIWTLFHENNIEIPYPQQDVYVKTLPDDFSPWVQQKNP